MRRPRDAYAPKLPPIRGMPSTESRKFKTQQAADEQRERIAQLEQEARERAQNVDRHVTAVKSRLSARHWRAGWGQELDDFSIANHERMFGWRHQRGGGHW